MSELIFYSIILLIGVFISAISQAILKKESLKKHDSVSKEYLNVNVIIAYVLFVGTTFLSIYAYKVVPLSMGPVLESTSYIWITLIGVLIFKEIITKRKMFAIIMIIAGISIFSLCA